MQKKSATKKKAGRPKLHDKDNTIATSAERNTLPGEKRKTYIVKELTASEMEAIAFYEGSKIKDVVNTAFTDYIQKWKLVNGELRLPKKK